MVLSRASQNKLLAQGHRLVQNALSTSSGWRNEKIVSPLLTRFPEPKPKTVYSFANVPPTRPPHEAGLCDLKEWGSVVTQDEVFSLDDLDEFVNTDLGSIFRNNAHQEQKLEPQLLTNPIIEKRERSPDSVSEPQAKRRKLEMGALYGFIPKPHVYPSPFCPSPSPPKGKPFEKTEPVFIAPYITFSLPDDARVAWLIPVRGTFPWKNCTSGAFLDPSHIIPIPSSPVVNDQVSWTQGSILDFWDFLLRLRKVGKLGPLGISFNFSPQSRISSATTNVDHHQTHPDLSFLLNVTTTIDTSTYPQETRCNLSMVDYIKINHDAPCRLHVRNALDAWSYEVKDPDGSVKKTRLLKGARLVLVDASSRGIQIS
ncbi:hypothetical protein BYT27DRAFT_7259330 [Phlegmacium glaucopus]|nr:hypothetical protein BYT27DRAFT_7259330 [Phlegmacium glaucopus]